MFFTPPAITKWKYILTVFSRNMKWIWITLERHLGCASLREQESLPLNVKPCIFHLASWPPPTPVWSRMVHGTVRGRLLKAGPSLLSRILAEPSLLLKSWGGTMRLQSNHSYHGVWCKTTLTNAMTRLIAPRKEISASAQWIWSEVSTSSLAYCRKLLATPTKTGDQCGTNNDCKIINPKFTTCKIVNKLRTCITIVVGKENECNCFDNQFCTASSTCETPGKI